MNSLMRHFEGFSYTVDSSKSVPCYALHGHWLSEDGKLAVSLVPKNYGMARIHLDGFSPIRENLMSPDFGSC